MSTNLENRPSLEDQWSSFIFDLIQKITDTSLEVLESKSAKLHEENEERFKVIEKKLETLGEAIDFIFEAFETHDVKLDRGGVEEEQVERAELESIESLKEIGRGLSELKEQIAIDSSCVKSLGSDVEILKKRVLEIGDSMVKLMEKEQEKPKRKGFLGGK